MKIALIGFGKMGKAILPIARERGHEVTLVRSASELETLTHENTDCAIEFTRPEAAVANIRFCISQRIPVVVGTTGWYAEYDGLCHEVQNTQSSLLAATNFSIGVNLFFHVNKVLAQLMNRYPEYDVNITEIHHTEKLDAPSGTAITTAERILQSLDRKNSWKLHPAAAPDQIEITALREPDVPGTHEVRWQSDIDELTITHTAHGRRGFALGAVLAAEFLHGKQGIFTMNDLLQIHKG
jgi:4-hydroxy-tetrahydrodipicolinate reductase